MLFSELKIGNVYSFSTRSPAYFSSKVERAKLLSICDLETARLHAPVDQTYAAVFPSLPVGSTYDMAGQQYYVFKEQNGNKLVMAAQWIVESSLEEIQAVTCTVHIPSLDLSMVDKIGTALRAVGITNFAIKQE